MKIDNILYLKIPNQKISPQKNPNPNMNMQKRILESNQYKLI